jgi:hypothetical protein
MYLTPHQQGSAPVSPQSERIDPLGRLWYIQRGAFLLILSGSSPDREAFASIGLWPKCCAKRQFVCRLSGTSAPVGRLLALYDLAQSQSPTLLARVVTAS